MDAVLLILALLSISVPFIIAKLWWWVGFWVTLSIILAIVEIAAKVITGKTISQQFWAWRRDVGKPWEKWFVFLGMTAFWIYLLCHLFL
jgi:hypothetical protein